jgi:energy-coupling factor transporter ATP-binding protein EcfA2
VLNVPPSPEAAYYQPEVDRLLVALEEATRATPDGSVFVPPAGGELAQAQANFHHFVFGRRGSGKTTLLRHLERKLRDEGRGIAWIDQEIFMELSYPDVLVSSVLEVTKGIRRAVAASLPGASRRGIGRLFRKPAESPDLGAQQRVVQALDRVITNLETLRFAPNDRKIEWTRVAGTEDAIDAIGAVKLPAVEVKAGASANASTNVTSTETIESSKEEYLERSLVDVRALLRSAAQFCEGGFVFLDEFYRVDRADQPRVLGYLHRLVKDTGFWLKVGSVRYWTTPYSGGSPPRGMQVTQDANVISLDRGLQLAESTRDFLETILDNIAATAGASRAALLTDGALKRLVLASGGVPRDYLRLTAQAIHQAKNRGPTAKSGSGKVMAEDVNQAAGQTAPAKIADLHQDAPAEAAALERLLADLAEFCRRHKAAYFLVDTQDQGLGAKVDQLQDLRFAHLLFESETVPDEGSRRHKVLLLDVAYLSAQRALEVDFEGWQDRERRRRRQLVYREGAGAALTAKGPEPVEELEQSLALFQSDSAPA